ncbi:MAG: ABC transporter substrate-binding protein [Chloroflexi bacterium]|nr:ABC transporter substrate-binding protein [Chloroflexota bacterium]
MKHHKWHTLAFVAFLLIALVAGCAQPAPAPATPTQAPKAAPTEVPKAAAPAKEAKPEAKPVAKESKPVAEPKKEAKPPVKQKVAYSALSGMQAPLWVAKEKGLFQKYGLDVEVTYIATSSTLVQSMLAGEINLAQTGGGPVVNATVEGGDLIFIAGTTNVLVFYLYGRPEIKRMEDLKGKTVAAGRLGSSGDFATRTALQRYKLEPDKDVTLVAAGGPPERLAALLSGGVQAAILGPPTTLKAKQAGMNEVLNLAELEIPFIQTTLAISKGYLAKNRETMLNFMKAYVEGIAVAKKDRNYAMKVIGEYTKTDDKEMLEETYDTVLPKVTPRVPYLPADAVQAQLNEVADENPKAKGAKPEAFFDNSLVKELDDSGFIKKLYE